MTEIIRAGGHGAAVVQRSRCGSRSAGAAQHMGAEATAYWNRQAQWDLLLFGAWTDHSQDARNVQVLRDLWKGFEPFTQGLLRQHGAFGR